MKRKHQNIVYVLLIGFVFFTACGNLEAPQANIPTGIESAGTPESTPTLNLCAPENINAEVDKVNRLMREFDDASMLAASVQRDQLSTAIANLQRIRRDAEDLKIPPCLKTLKSYQITHMNTVINTLIAFLGGTDQKAVNQGIAQARQQHDQYTLELARLLGITVVPADTPITTDQTPEPVYAAETPTPQPE
jgi:hypothetical protein